MYFYFFHRDYFVNSFASFRNEQPFNKLAIDKIVQKQFPLRFCI